MKREFQDYVDDILSAADKIEAFIGTMDLAAFNRDEKTVFAVIHALEVMGEAASKIPSAIRRHHPEIPWKEISGMRNKLIHEYFGVDLETVWKTASEDVPALKKHFLKLKRSL
jgi:uncharacterized protein with HEPN domain